MNFFQLATNVLPDFALFGHVLDFSIAMLRVLAVLARKPGDVITALPVSNFASQLIGGLPFVTAGSFQNDLVTDPKADDVKLAVESFGNAIKQINGVDIEKDLLGHLNGDYALALLPRPNFPLPILNVPFDLILVGKVDSGIQTQDSIV